jgi:hypothetical protein
MMIEEYELMAHARRAFLDWSRRATKEGIELSAHHRKASKALEADARLEGAVLMVWDSTPEGDFGWTAALRWLLEHAEGDLAGAHIPAAERPRYLEGRRRAIERTLAKLDASLLP